MNEIAAFAADVKAGPLWVQYWLAFLSLVLMLAFPFALVRKEARVAALVVALTFPAMIALYSLIGFVRLLGIVHVVFWTPFVIYLWRRRDDWRVKESLSGKWLVLLFLTMIVSLAFDYADVVRWLLGERG
jgi:hypothetical protein